MGESFDTYRTRFLAAIAGPAELLRLFDYVPNAYLYVKDLEGRFMMLNQSRVAMSGVKSEAELLGKTDLDLHPAYWGERYRREDRVVIETDRAIVGQVWLVPDSRGQLATFVSSKIPLHDATGKCIGIAGVMYHIEPNLENQAERPLEAARRYITEHYAESVTVTAIAAAARLSTSQLNRRFKSLYHMSPSHYLQRVRVHEASRLLCDSEWAMSDIALRTGFYDQAHMTRMFRKWMQMSPTQFRKLSHRTTSSHRST